uniref:Secreted protein n=1 Tax=Grammatophora oceanica TaxID=210454 RepID=A0A7S1Y7H9_9STRA
MLRGAVPVLSALPCVLLLRGSQGCSGSFDSLRFRLNGFAKVHYFCTTQSSCRATLRVDHKLTSFLSTELKLRKGRHLDTRGKDLLHTCRWYYIARRSTL